MKMTVSFLHMEHTPALDLKIQESTAKMTKILKDKGTIKWSCYVKNGEHFAEVYYHALNCEYHAKASSSNMYHSIDIAIDKMEKQFYKRKEKYNKMHVKKEDPVILDPNMAWTDYDEDAA